MNTSNGMKIIVKAKAGAKLEKIERVDQPSLNFDNEKLSLPVYKVWVREPAVDGKANKAIIRVLSEHFKVAPSLITLVSGQISKQKIFEISL
ncbi:MAG: DUF167 domain-containing protein [Minisyncoccia bacterium]